MPRESPNSHPSISKHIIKGWKYFTNCISIRLLRYRHKSVTVPRFIDWSSKESNLNTRAPDHMTILWLIFKDKTFQLFHGYLQNLENIYPWKFSLELLYVCVISCSFLRWHSGNTLNARLKLHCLQGKTAKCLPPTDNVPSDWDTTFTEITGHIKWL